MVGESACWYFVTIIQFYRMTVNHGCREERPVTARALHYVVVLLRIGGGDHEETSRCRLGCSGAVSMVTIIWYSSRCSRRGLLLFFRYAVCSVQARRDLGVAGRFPKFKPRSNVRWCKRVLELVRKAPGDTSYIDSPVFPTKSSVYNLFCNVLRRCSDTSKLMAVR